MKTILRLMLPAAGLALLAGCVVAPAGPPGAITIRATGVPASPWWRRPRSWSSGPES